MTRTLFLAALRSVALAVALASAFAAAHATARAFLVGLLLGGLVWGMAQARPGDPASLAMAGLTVVAGAASFVCHALARQPAARPAVRGWLLWLAAGVLLAMQALDALS